MHPGVEEAGFGQCKMSVLDGEHPEVWEHLDLSSFRFCPRSQAFNWRLLHGLDIDAVVRWVSRLTLAACLDVAIMRNI